MTLTKVCEFKMGDDVDKQEIVKTLESNGFDVEFQRQTHDTIRDVESLQYNIEIQE